MKKNAEKIVLKLLYYHRSTTYKSQKIKTNGCAYIEAKLMLSNSHSDFILTSVFQVTNSRLSKLSLKDTQDVL